MRRFCSAIRSPLNPAHNRLSLGIERLPAGSLKAASSRREGGEKTPLEGAPKEVKLPTMNTLLLVIVLLLLFGGGGFYVGGPAYGGGGLGLVLLICLIIFLFGGFRAKN